MHNEELREKIIVAIHSYEREIKQELPLSDSEYGDLADRILALMPPVGEKGLREAFLAGAKWWEFHTTDATMWQSDQADTWKEAEKRYGPGERSDPIAALRPAAPQVVECPTCKSQDVNCSDPWHIDHSPAQQPEVVLSPLDRSRMVEAVTQMPEDDELAQQPEAGVDDGLPFMCNMSCCGRDDGIIVFSTWEEAEKFRESYTSGVAVAEHGYSAGPHESGHKRAVVITQAQWDGPLGIWRPRAAIASPAPGAPAAQKWWRYRCDVEQCGFERTSRNYFKVYGTCHACGVGAMRVVEEGEA